MRVHSKILFQLRKKKVKTLMKPNGSPADMKNMPVFYISIPPAKNMRHLLILRKEDNHAG